MARTPRQTSRPSAPPAVAGRGLSRELILVLLVFVAGVGLRVAYPSRMAVEHFDEGVYASNRWFGAPDFHYPNQNLYAPSLLPSLIEWSLVLFGPSNFAAVLPSLIAGCLTMPLVWWVMRGWFGPRTALAAMILVAGSDLHIAFSRAALTDALLLFWLLAAVGAGGRAFATRSFGWAVTAGVLTGLAWWTKYNGWLALAILGSGGAAWELITLLANRRSPQTLPEDNPAGNAPDSVALLMRVSQSGSPDQRPSPWRRITQTAGLWVVIAGTAILIWAPYLVSLQDHGGYAAVRANHSHYFVGWSGWLNSFGKQAAHLDVFTSWIGVASGALALLLPQFLRKPDESGSTWNLQGILASCVAAVTAATLLAFPSWAIGAGGTASLLVLIRNRYRIGAPDDPREDLPLLLSLAWFCGLLLATPLYTPYLRLTLPWFLIATVAYGRLLERVGGAAHLLAGGQAGSALPTSQRRYLIVMVIFQVVTMGSYWPVIFRALNQQSPPEWQSRTTYSEIAPQVLREIARDQGQTPPALPTEFAIYTYAEPALLFQLRLAGAAHVPPVEHLSFAKPQAAIPLIPTYVVTGPQAYRTAGFPAQLQEARPRLRLIRKFPLALSNLVLLDQQTEAGATAEEPALELWRVE